MRLFLLFLIVPLIEIALFIQIGGIIGLGWTLLIVILTAILGTILVRSQGLAVLNRLRMMRRFWRAGRDASGPSGRMGGLRLPARRRRCKNSPTQQPMGGRALRRVI